MLYVPGRQATLVSIQPQEQGSTQYLTCLLLTIEKPINTFNNFNKQK